MDDVKNQMIAYTFFVFVLVVIGVFYITQKENPGIYFSDEIINNKTIITQCNDGKDNDFDNLKDFPADPGCIDFSDDSEHDYLNSNQKDLFKSGMLLLAFLILLIIIIVFFIFYIMITQHRNTKRKIQKKNTLKEEIKIMKEIKKMLNEGEIFLSKGKIAAARERYRAIQEKYHKLETENEELYRKIKSFYEKITEKEK